MQEGLFSSTKPQQMDANSECISPCTCTYVVLMVIAFNNVHSTGQDEALMSSKTVLKFPIQSFSQSPMNTYRVNHMRGWVTLTLPFCNAEVLNLKYFLREDLITTWTLY